MINERQKKTTDNYRDNYDRIFKSQRKRLEVQRDSIDMDPNNTSGDRPCHPTPAGVVGDGPAEGEGVADEGVPCPDTLGCGCC